MLSTRDVRGLDEIVRGFRASGEEVEELVRAFRTDRKELDRILRAWRTATR